MQLTFAWTKKEDEEHEHDPDCNHTNGGFISQASVPPCYVCGRCLRPLWQRLPPEPDQPEKIGYITADWAWHYRDGQPWTTLD